MIEGNFKCSLFIFIVLLCTPNLWACQSLVPAELLYGCTFDPMTIMAPSTGFQVSQDTCNNVIAKEIFSEQPYVYFNKAIEVSENC